MTAANTHRHKRRVAPGSGQNKRRRAAQTTQSQSTGSTNCSGGGPNDLAPSKVSGTRIQIGSDFGVMARNTGIIVDKTLIFKVFLKPGRAPVCVCLPRRFGKTFNLSTIEELLNMANNSDAHPVNGHIDVQARHQARERLFEGTPLKEREPELFSHCFCKHPVIRLGLKIPDDDHHRAWDDMLLTAIFDSDSGIAWAKERKSMLDRLYVGDMRDIHQKFNHVLQRFSNASGAMYEATSANIFRTFILLKMVLPLPQGDMDDYLGGDEMGPISMNEGQSGDGCFDWRVVFLSCGPHRPKSLCVTFEFKRIHGASNQTSSHPLRMAQEGLEQIIGRRHATDISHAHRRLDEWDQQHIASDNAGWVDEHGWITERISDEFRVFDS
ncbi:hypothetical protein GQ54DRAFT_336495 [Martensiomyces pterosporus]|nr:hypothetical protein GQ54DRAFT_336495 [Martensiomyces pterosporus]